MQKIQNSKLHKGFTLIEISIVVIVVGLLVAGVLGGQEVIKAMKINATISQMNEITAAANSFKSKYDSLPGDMPDATDYWGATGTGMAVGPSSDQSCIYSNNQAKTTCNGDGDGLIMFNNSYNNFEADTIWQHLWLAEMYITSDPSESDNRLFLSKQLRTQFSDNISMYVSSHIAISSFPPNPALIKKNNFNFFDINTSWINSDIARLLDLKIDDGKPLTGIFSVYLVPGGGTIHDNCITSIDDNAYALNVNACVPYTLANF